MQTALHDVGQARRFLALALPWPDETITGVFNVVTKAPPKGDRKTPFWNHIGVRSIDDAIAAILHQINKRNATDIYGWMALGNIATAEPINAKRPDSWTKGNRLAENAVWFKSIFLDIDSGPAKTYKTLPDARAAFDDFLSHAKLPKPNVIVASGHGFHCHWTLQEPILVGKWQELSGRLIGAVEQHKLSVDTEVTLDRARILRVPGTWNNKDPDHPVKVELIHEDGPFFLQALERALAPYQPSLGTPHTPKGAASPLPPGMTPRAPLSGGPEMAAGVEQPHIEIWIDEVANECPLIADTLATNGRDQANPLWHQMVWMASFCEEGRTVAHDLSSGHATYSEDETDAEFDRVLKTREARPELGWTSCRKFHDAGGEKFCKGCPHLAEDKSPFNFTFESNPEIPIDVLDGLSIGDGNLFLPPGYIHHNQLVCKIVPPDEEGSPISYDPVFEKQMITAAWLTENPNPKEINFAYVREGNNIAHIHERARCNLNLLSKPAEMAGHFAAQGFMIQKPKEAGGLLVPWVEELQKAQDNIYHSSDAFGWIERNNKIAGFAYDGFNWAPKPWPAPWPTLDHYRPQGELSVWKDATKLITSQKRPELERLLGDTARGIQVFAWSRESGVTKTAAMTVAAAVWGHPLLTMNQANDTTNAVDKKMGDLRHLPVLWDEFKTSEDTDAFIMHIFRASSGKGKSRLTSETGYRPVGSWATIIACASNAPMLDRVYQAVGRTAAGALRVFEYEIVSDKKRMTMATEAKTMLLALETNYGHAGRVYAKWLGENFEAITEELNQFRSTLERELDNPAQERFWSATTTVLVKGAEFARRLGLVDFDTRAIASFCLKLVSNMRGDAGRMILDPINNIKDLKDVLNAFRGDLQHDQMIRFESVPTGPGRQAFAYKPFQYNVNNLRRFSICESDKEDLIRFTVRSLADWLIVRKRQNDPIGEYGSNEIAKAMERLLGAVVKHQRHLAPGHPKDPGKGTVIEISTALHPDLKATFS
jgi:hypothetical protein